VIQIAIGTELSRSLEKYRVFGKGSVEDLPLRVQGCQETFREKTIGSEVFSINLFEDLSNNPPSHGGTELLNPSTRLPFRHFAIYPSPIIPHCLRRTAILAIDTLRRGFRYQAGQFLS